MITTTIKYLTLKRSKKEKLSYTFHYLIIRVWVKLTVLGKKYFVVIYFGLKIFVRNILIILDVATTVIEFQPVNLFEGELQIGAVQRALKGSF